MAEILTLNQIENSKIFVHPKSETLQFKHPMDYLEPFLQKFDNLNIDWHFQGDDRTVNAERGVERHSLLDDSEGIKNVAYGSIIAKAKLPEEFNIIPDINSQFKDMWGEIGLVYNLSSLKPEMRLYKGKRVSICSNGCIFGANNITNISLTTSYHRIYDETERYIEQSFKDIERYKRISEYMYETVLDVSGIRELTGELFFFGKKNKELGVNPISDAVSSLMDNSSKYAINSDETTTKWNYYNALTESLKKSSILTESTKVELLQRVFIKDSSLYN